MTHFNLRCDFGQLKLQLSFHAFGRANVCAKINFPPRSVYRSKAYKNFSALIDSHRSRQAEIYPPLAHQIPSIYKSRPPAYSAGYLLSVRSLTMRRSILAMALPPLEFLAGRRCLRLPKQVPSQTTGGENNNPLVLIGGTAQSITSWQAHYHSLAIKRDVVVYEARGQGPRLEDDLFDGDYSDCSMERHVDDLQNFFAACFPCEKQKIDVAGFSFGGRLALAHSSTGQGNVDKLHVTGVAGLVRDSYARVILRAWEEMLLGDGEATTSALEENRRLKAFIYSSLLSTYSKEFIASNERMVSKWVEFGMSQNTVEGVGNIVAQSHGDDDFDVRKSSERLGALMREKKGPSSVRLISGSLDMLCGGSLAIVARGLDELSNVIGPATSTKIFEGAGHAILLEDPKGWRVDVEEFLGS